MVKLKKAIGVSSVDLNITNLETGKVVDTVPLQYTTGLHSLCDVEFNETENTK
jgi:hypothetical protein